MHVCMYACIKKYKNSQEYVISSGVLSFWGYKSNLDYIFTRLGTCRTRVSMHGNFGGIYPVIPLGSPGLMSKTLLAKPVPTRPKGALWWWCEYQSTDWYYWPGICQQCRRQSAVAPDTRCTHTHTHTHIIYTERHSRQCYDATGWITRRTSTLLQPAL